MSSARTFFLNRKASTARWPLAVAVIGAAIAHLSVIGTHLEEAPYMGVLFIVLTGGCFTLTLAAAAYDTAPTRRRS